MDGDEISAFAAYSLKKMSQKSDLNKKSKMKVKKKNKPHNNSVNSIVNTLIKVTESSAPGNLNGENQKKNTHKNGFIKAMLKTQKESIFKDCTLTTKVDNLFLKENSAPNKNTHQVTEKSSLNSIKPKKSRKKKLLNIENSKSKHKHVKNSVLKNEMEYGSESSPEEVKTKISKSSVRNNSKELKEKSKMPNIIFSDSVKVGEEVFSWMLSPLKVDDFFKNCWEQKPLHIAHKNRNYFKCICTFDDFKQALRDHDMYFTRNIDVTSYIDGERHTENPEGKAKPTMVWDLYRNGRSIRLLNPQTFIPNVRLLNTTLQEFFHCFVGANIYLTPAGTQGFAPHYDDIEAFVLQLEGEKHWKLYNPRSPDEVLPRESSRNFREDEIGEPILEVTMKPGDLLYFPRGIIHQAKCLPHVHSLHITISCYQRNSWADLLEKVLPVALQKTISEDAELRKGLPIGYLNNLGLIHSDSQSIERKELIKTFEELLQRVIDNCPLDAGVDQLGADYIHDALPPFLNKVEEVYGADRNYEIEDEDFLSILKNSSDKNLSVKLIRATAARLVSEGDEMILYYTTDNSLVYHEHEAASIIISTQWAQGVEYLIHSYPKFVQMKELPVSIKVNTPEDEFDENQKMAEDSKLHQLLTEAADGTVDEGCLSKTSGRSY